MLNPDVMVRFYGMPTESDKQSGQQDRTNVESSQATERHYRLHRAAGREHIRKIQRAGEGYDLASAIARLEAGDTSIKAKSMVYTEGTDLENLPKDIMTMHEKADAAAETLEQLKQMQQTEQPKPEEKEKKKR